MRTPRGVLLAAFITFAAVACSGTAASDVVTPATKTNSLHYQFAALSAGEPIVADPCWDHADLEAGRGSSERQDWYNHLDARDYARAEMACSPWFWGGDQFDALDHIVMAESKWYTLADGPGDCWGIPQACPGSKMSSHGADWQTNNRVQTRWQLDYIAHGQPGKFHDPISAWMYRQRHGSY